MRILKLFLLGLLTSLAPLLVVAAPHANGVITANAGTTFELGSTGDPLVLSHTVDGLAQVSLIGNCTVHFDTLVQVPPPGEAWKVSGSMRFASADGSSVLRMDVTGWVMFDPANPAFANFHYDGVITSGEGEFAGARGKAEIDGAGLLTSATTGKATWLLKGNVFTRPSE